MIRNGLSTLDPDRDSIIAIGGAGFDVRPFLLKGYPIDGVVQTDDVYNLHLTPETESRVAVLETGDADFPLVEIHYNAIDLTGDTMGTSGPCLLVPTCGYRVVPYLRQHSLLCVSSNDNEA